MPVQVIHIMKILAKCRFSFLILIRKPSTGTSNRDGCYIQQPSKQLQLFENKLYGKLNLVK